MSFYVNGLPENRAPGMRQDMQNVCGDKRASTEVSTLIKKIAHLERDQTADEGRIYAVLRRAEAEIANLQRRYLDPEALRSAIAAIRDKTALLTQDVRKNMHQRIVAARKLQETLGPHFIAQQTRFASEDATDAALRTRFFKILQRTSTSALLNHLKDAIEIGNFACAESIRFEFMCRTDRHLYSAEYEAIRGMQRDDDPAEIKISSDYYRQRSGDSGQETYELTARGPS